jgi:molybdenum cofactor synthesis domain-containing protein
MSFMLINGYRAAVITASDKGFSGERVDTSGAYLMDALNKLGYQVVSYCVLPDDKDTIAAEMIRLADNDLCELVLTTGGTGLSPRDVTPEATLSVADKLVPGISEAMRAFSMTVTHRAMLSRGVYVMRNKTLIINMPGSQKAVEECFDVIADVLPHGISTMRGESGECAR